MARAAERRRRDVQAGAHGQALHPEGDEGRVLGRRPLVSLVLTFVQQPE